MESYEKKKPVTSEESISQTKAETVEINQGSIIEEEVIAEEITSPDILSGLEVVAEEVITPDEEKVIEDPASETKDEDNSVEEVHSQDTDQVEDLDENKVEDTPNDEIEENDAPEVQEASNEEEIIAEIATPDILSEPEIITPEEKVTEEPISEIKGEDDLVEEIHDEVTDKVVDSDENKVDEASEGKDFLETIHEENHDEDDDLFKEGEQDESIKHVHDYSSLSKVQLVEALRKVLSDESLQETRPHAEAIKASFYKIRNAEIQEQKQAFVAEGNDETLFVPEQDPLENELKELLKEYRNQRAEVNKRQDNLKEENYHKKLAIIDEIKALIHSEESLNLTFQEFNELQERWRKIGQVPQTKVKDLWETYHYHVELFYDFVKINRELRDLDLRRNMDLKLELCKKAEELAENNSDAQASFKELQKLHESWREIGPVPREGKQELWDRFKAATSQVNKRYQQYFEQERALQREQLQKKIELCELAEIYSGFESDNPREWNDITEKVIALQEEWKNSGYGPRKENAKIWDRFRAANDAFFQNKRNFWNASKDNLNKNLSLKMEICEQAEKLKDSEDWKATTDKLITLQKKWKEVGPVPRKQSEIIWKKFRTACDEFFNRKVQHFSGITGDQDENYKAKKTLIAEIEAFQPSANAKENIETLKKFQERWSEIGFVPFRKKEELQNRFHSLMEAQFDKLKLDDQDVQLYKFKSKVEHWASIPGGWGKINTERDRCVQHLKQLESDINTLGNNVGFFGSSKGAQSLIEGVNAQIEKIKKQIDYLKTKIKIIDEQDERV